MQTQKPTDASKSTVLLRHIVVSGFVFGLVMCTVFRVTTGSWLYGFHIGTICGFGFGLAVKMFLNLSATTPTLELDGRDAAFELGENVIHWGPANHFKGIEAVGGKLFLTNRRLRFRSHKFNVRRHDESYPLESIALVEPTNTLGIIPNAIRVHLADGRRERFVVMNRGAWLHSLTTQREDP